MMRTKDEMMGILKTGCVSISRPWDLREQEGTLEDLQILLDLEKEGRVKREPSSWWHGPSLFRYCFSLTQR